MRVAPGVLQMAIDFDKTLSVAEARNGWTTIPRGRGQRRRATVAEAHLSVIARELATLPVGASGAIEWTARSKKRWASAGFHVVAIANSLNRRADLSWSVIAASGTREERKASLLLEPARVTFGARCWVRCPKCAHRRAALYLPTPHEHLQCRVCARLGYFTQQLTRPDRRTYRVRRFVHRRLAAEWMPCGAPRPRPQGMHHRTYRRHVEELVRLERERDDFFFFFFAAPGLMVRCWSALCKATSR